MANRRGHNSMFRGTFLTGSAICSSTSLIITLFKQPNDKPWWERASLSWGDSTRGQLQTLMDIRNLPVHFPTYSILSPRHHLISPLLPRHLVIPGVPSVTGLSLCHQSCITLGWKWIRNKAQLRASNNIFNLGPPYWRYPCLVYDYSPRMSIMVGTCLYNGILFLLFLALLFHLNKNTDTRNLFWHGLKTFHMQTLYCCWKINKYNNSCHAILPTIPQGTVFVCLFASICQCWLQQVFALISCYFSPESLLFLSLFYACIFLIKQTIDCWTTRTMNYTKHYF